MAKIEDRAEEGFRHDADHGVGLAIHRDGLPEDVETHREFIPPERVTEDNHLVLSGFAFDLGIVFPLTMAAVATLTLLSVAFYVRDWVRHMGSAETQA